MLTLALLLALLAALSPMLQPSPAVEPATAKHGTWSWPSPLLRALGWGAVGFGVCYGLGYLLLNHNAFPAASLAMAEHRHWKDIDWSLGNIFYYAGLNLLEYALWTGIPIAVLFGIGVREALRNRDRALPVDILTLALFATVLATAFIGRTAAETARLWLFFTPLVLVVASRRIGTLLETRREIEVTAFLLYQLGAVVVTKMYQDFL
jgi:hypothetical protein